MSFPSYEEIKAAANAVIVAAHPDHQVLAYEPTHLAPNMIYTVLAGVALPRATGQVRVRIYRLLHRVCFLWQDNEQAEIEMDPYVDSMPAAFEANPQMDTITLGLAAIVEILADYVTVGGVKYRVLDCYNEIVVKG